MSIKVYQDNFFQVRRQLLEYSNDVEAEMAEMVREMLGIISIISVADFMVTQGTGGSGEGRFESQAAPDKLTIRDRLLAASVLGTQLPATYTAGSQAMNPAGSQHHIENVYRSGDVLSGELGSSLPYAAIHEYGGEFDVPVTQKMRSFFWAKWYNSGGDKWKAMALTQKTSFHIRMPKRPYLEPARDKAMQSAIPKYLDKRMTQITRTHNL